MDDNHQDGHAARRVAVSRDREEPGQPAVGSKKQDEKKPGGFGRFFLIILGLALVLAGLGLYAWHTHSGDARERADTAKAVQAGAQTVQVVKPSRTPPSFDFSLPGSAEPISTATLYARVNGFLKKRLVDIGDHVTAGQLLAEIDAPDIDAQLNQSRAQLEQTRAAQGIAQVTFDREQKLLGEKVVSKQEYDQNQATLNQAVANVKAAEANVQNLTAQQGFERITAPFTGVITARFLDDGALIASGGSSSSISIYTLAQPDTLRVFINVPQSYVANLSVGQETEVTAPEYPQKVFKGKLTRMADSLDATARTERVEIQLPSEGGKLVPGMYLNVRFKVEQAEPALVVPANTVDIRREGPRVAVVSPEKKVHYQSVKLGRDFGKTIEIVSGLQGDESLVVNPTTDLLEGVTVDLAKN